MPCGWTPAFGATFFSTGVKIGGPNQNPWGWFGDLPANEGKTARHQVGVTPCDLPREGWTRNYDNPHVRDLREYLQQNNGIKGLEICEPHEVEKAVRIFHRDGFVAVKNCLSPEILARMRATTDRAIMQAIESGPPGAHSAPLAQPSVGASATTVPTSSSGHVKKKHLRLNHCRPDCARASPAELRYSIGGSSASRQWFHDDAYCELIDLPTTTPILTAIFGSPDYLVGGAGGDCALPGLLSLLFDGVKLPNRSSARLWFSFSLCLPSIRSYRVSRTAS
jgi:hypothetical protein